MKPLSLLVMLALVTACAAAGAGGPLETKVLTQGGYAAADFQQPQAMAAHDQETLQRLWPNVGPGTPPSLAENETVVFLFAGTRPTGGWSIQPPTAKIENGILVIEAPVKGPAAGAIVTQAFTSPYLVLTVNTRTFDDLLWKR